MLRKSSASPRKKGAETTADDLEWVFKHKKIDAKYGKNYITLPNSNVYNEHLILNIVFHEL